MSGIEIVAGVAAVVQAFNGSVTLYRSWRDKRRERLENAQNQNLERSLTIGGTTVQREYDGHFARLGREFAVGDDRAKAELTGYVIKLQHTIITMMTESNSSFALVLPSLPTIYSTSEDTRMGVVSALAQQYQRIAQARPLSGSCLLTGPSQATTSAGTSTSSSDPVFRICRAGTNPRLEKKWGSWAWHCDCGYATAPRGLGGSRPPEPHLISPKESDIHYPAIEEEYYKYHLISGRPVVDGVAYSNTGREDLKHFLYCPICYDGSLRDDEVDRYTEGGMHQHLKDNHKFSELKSKNLLADGGINRAAEGSKKIGRGARGRIVRIGDWRPVAYLKLKRVYKEDTGIEVYCTAIRNILVFML
ncbi:hypothetical protein G7Y89_g12873 [Cudoniella acicularis]|uniref:Uncharacterized protein n=1 Tax=Cudoniella acicularis TaxID=354080 RepID=A0A8H4RAZ8_9HELO|nr:hypothetical protein G7Y89_g12873 [Cudoniella acicularis]